MIYRKSRFTKSTRYPSGCFNHKNFNYKYIYNETFCGKYSDFRSISLVYLSFQGIRKKH